MTARNAHSGVNVKRMSQPVPSAMPKPRLERERVSHMEFTSSGAPSSMSARPFAYTTSARREHTHALSTHMMDARIRHTNTHTRTRYYHLNRLFSMGVHITYILIECMRNKYASALAAIAAVMR